MRLLTNFRSNLKAAGRLNRLQWKGDLEREFRDDPVPLLEEIWNRVSKIMYSVPLHRDAAIYGSAILVHT